MAQEGHCQTLWETLGMEENCQGKEQLGIQHGADGMRQAAGGRRVSPEGSQASARAHHDDGGC